AGAPRTEPKLARGGAVGVDPPELMTGLPLRVDDRVALRRPAWLRLEAARGELARVGAVGVHDEDVRRARAVGHEGEVPPGGRPRRLGVDAGVARQAAQPARREGEHVDL